MKIKKDDLYIRIKNNSSLIVSPDDDGLALSVHVPGGHMMVSLSWDQGMDLLEALKMVLEDQWDA